MIRRNAVVVVSPWEGELIEVERNGRKVKVIMRMRITMRVSSIVG